MNLKTIWTNTGMAKRTNAELTGTLVSISHIAFGDALITDDSTQEFQPTQDMVELINEVYRRPVDSVAIDNVNPSWINVEGHILAPDGGWWIREIGLYDADGDLVAVGNCSPRYKPILAEGESTDQYFKLILLTANTAVITLKIDPAMALASRSYVNISVAEAPNLIHRVANIAALREIIGRINIGIQTVQTLGYYTIGDGGGGLVWHWQTESMLTDNGINVVKPTLVDVDSPGRWVRNYDDKLLFLIAGGIGDSETDDFSRYQAAAALAGENGVISLSHGKTFNMAGVRPRLQDYPCIIMAAPDTKFKMDPNPGIKLLSLGTPVTVETPGGGLRRFHKNIDRDTTLALAGAGAASAMRMQQKTAVSDFTADWIVQHIFGKYTVSAAAATVTATSVTWPAGFAAEQEGIYRAPRAHMEVSSVTFTHSGPLVGAGPYISAEIVGDLYRYAVAFNENSTQVYIYRHDGVTVATIPLPNQFAYTITPGGSLTLSMRVFDRKVVEVYANDLLIVTFDVTAHDGNSQINYYGYATAFQLSQKIGLSYPFFTTKSAPRNARPVQVTIIGDSISYGAWASMDYGEHLQHMLSMLPGFGAMTVRNHAVSSSSTVSWVAGGSYNGDGAVTNYSLAGEDFTPDDYVLVMLGTNDCQGAIALATFVANLGTIADKIVADGAIPIFGIPPVWAYAVGTNPYNIAVYGAAIRNFCLSRGYQVAEVRAAIGSNIAWYYDGIHPHEEGQVAVAQAFAAAIFAAGSPLELSDLPVTAVSTYYNNWVAYGSANYRNAAYERIGKRVYLLGMIKSGTVATSNSAAFILPVNCRPLKNIFTNCASYSGANGYKQATILITTSGTVEVWAGENGWVSFDGIQFDV